MDALHNQLSDLRENVAPFTVKQEGPQRKTVALENHTNNIKAT